MIARKLIVEQPNFDLEFDIIQENRDAEKRYYINGEYIMMNRKNKNRRVYEEMEMIPAINVFQEEFIKTGRAGGECNHSSSPDMDLAKLAHKIISLERSPKNPDYFIGKSMVLSTPSGKILEALIRDEMKFGMSTKCLGQISESNDGNFVKSPIILGVDAVYDPSVSTAFVNGILENKEYIIAGDGKIAESFEEFERKLAKFPSRYRSDIEKHILESFDSLFKKISQ